MIPLIDYTWGMHAEELWSRQQVDFGPGFFVRPEVAWGGQSSPLDFWFCGGRVLRSRVLVAYGFGAFGFDVGYGRRR